MNFSVSFYSRTDVAEIKRELRGMVLVSDTGGFESSVYALFLYF